MNTNTPLRAGEMPQRLKGMPYNCSMRAYGQIPRNLHKCHMGKAACRQRLLYSAPPQAQRASLLINGNKMHSQYTAENPTSAAHQKLLSLANKTSSTSKLQVSLRHPTSGNKVSIKFRLPGAYCTYVYTYICVCV